MINILISGGWMMIPILGCSLLALTISIERFAYFKNFGASSLAPKMLSLIEQEKFTDALAVAENQTSPVLHVISTGVLQRSNRPTTAMEAAAIAEVTKMKRGLPVLDTIITLGPLLGLLGTIIGIISSSKPIYPRVARESGWEGTVIVRTFINTNGVPGQVKIRKTCGHPTLDQAAQEAVKNWKFQPAKDGNIPIAKWVDIPIKFNLHS